MNVRLGRGDIIKSTLYLFIYSASLLVVVVVELSNFASIFYELLTSRVRILFPGGFKIYFRAALAVC